MPNDILVTVMEFVELRVGEAENRYKRERLQSWERFSETLTETVADIRNQQGLHKIKDSQVAEKLGITRSYFSRLKGKSRKWSPELVKRYMRAIKEIANEQK